MSEPRSPRLRKILAVLESIYTNPETSPEDKMRAIDKAQKILSRRPRKRKRRAAKQTSSAENALQAIRKIQNEGK